METIENGENRLLFSQRDIITQEAEDWCSEHDVYINSFNIVTALSILGYLNVEKIRVNCHKKEREKYGKSVISIERRIEKELDKKAGAIKK